MAVVAVDVSGPEEVENGWLLLEAPVVVDDDDGGEVAGGGATAVLVVGGFTAQHSAEDTLHISIKLPVGSLKTLYELVGTFNSFCAVRSHAQYK